MKYFSTFSGIGGFEIGIHNAWLNARKRRNNGELLSSTNLSDGYGRWTNPNCVGFSEIDKYATKVYERQFNGHKNYGDITTIDADGLPDFDCLVGGFPCQAFSIAGKRGGFDDTRGTLFFDLARIMRAKRPTLCVFENVKGLLSHDGGRTFDTIIRTLDELGYDIQWQVLNSKNHGVPQNRERIIIIGHLRGTPRPEVFPLGQNNPEVIELQGHYSNTLTARYEAAQATGTYIGESKLNAQIRQVNDPTHSNDRVYGADGIGPALNTMQGGNRQPKITVPVLTPDRLEKRQNGRRFKTDGEPQFTLNTQDRHGVYDGVKIRRLTPVECERLQAFPDNWTKYGEDEHGIRVTISDSQRYKMCGNAVTTNVIRDVFERILL